MRLFTKTQGRNMGENELTDEESMCYNCPRFVRESGKLISDGFCKEFEQDIRVVYNSTNHAYVHRRLIKCIKKFIEIERTDTSTTDTNGVQIISLQDLLQASTTTKEPEDAKPIRKRRTKKKT